MRGFSVGCAGGSVLDAGSGGREQSQIGVEGVDRHGVTARANRLRACEPRAEDRGGVLGGDRNAYPQAVLRILRIAIVVFLAQ
mgnify:CR=1 FL=1